MENIRTENDDVAWLAEVRATALTMIANREAALLRPQMGRPRRRLTLSQREKDKIWQDVKDFYQARDRGAA